MAFSKAVSFVKDVVSDSELRKSCAMYEDRQKLLDHLGFNEAEFEDALNSRLLKCQTYEEAEVYQQLKMWFSML